MNPIALLASTSVGLELIEKARSMTMSKDKIRSMKANSISEYARSTRSEPICMVDHTIFNNPEISDLVKSLTAVYAAMYTQAFSISINQEIGGIKVLQTLEKINPNRSMLEAGLAFESHTLKLPNVIGFGLEHEINNYNQHNKTNNYNDSNNKTTNITNNNINITDPDMSDKKNKSGLEVDTEAITKFSTNLSTGLLFNVEVTTQHGATVEIPISVRLLVNELRQKNILNILTAATLNQTAKDRYREWRAGALSFWKDIVLCKDLTREYRKNIIKDESGILNEVLRRKQNNTHAGMLSGQPSVSQISNMIVLSKETLAQFEISTGKKLRDQKTKDQIFNNTACLIIVILDTDRETATFHYHDIALPTTVTFKELKTAGKDKTPDLMEFLKSYQMGNGPRF